MSLILISKNVKLKWNGNNKKWYIDKGYHFTKHNDEFEVNVLDLSKGSHAEIEVLCDYCLESGIETSIRKIWKRYVRDNIESVVNKDCCSKCQQIKTKECNMVNFGVSSKTELIETKNKMKETTLKNHGVEHSMQNEEVKNKAKKTFMINYGFDNPMKNKEIVEKSNKSKIDRFGSTNPFTNENVMKKSIETNLKKYGTKWHMQNKSVMMKSKKTMYRNGSASCSRQQKYIYNLIGGELNYPVDRLSLDIAFPDEKIYVEYDGNGHNLSVKLGTVTKEKFETGEIKRYLFLKSKGWKQVRIISNYDYLPSDEVINKELEKAKEWFSVSGVGHSHYRIDIGLKINDDNYGVLRKIKEEDLCEGLLPNAYE